MSATCTHINACTYYIRTYVLCAYTYSRYVSTYVCMPRSGVCVITHAYCKSVSRSSETSANEKGTEPIWTNNFKNTLSTIDQGIAVQESKCTYVCSVLQMH